MRNRFATHLGAALTTALLLAGCAGAIQQSRPEDIPVLEQKVAEAPGNDDAAVRLGVAYYAAKRFADAERVLAAAVEGGSSNGAAYLYLGLANEEQQDFSGARAAYDKYMEVGRDAGLKDDIRKRQALVVRQELKQQARLVLDREQIVSAEPPTPNTIAVMPFQFTGATEELRPLQTALADMMVTDLSVSPAIKPVERVRLQALLDEMVLGQAGFTETAVNRAGRLLKAENVVQGAITMTGDRQIRIQGDVLRTQQGTSRGNVNGEQNLDGIFDLEKQIVFQIYQRLGITLTSQERERINENRTTNLLAFLAFGRGLESLDRGNFSEASTFFRQATQLDPNFSRAATQNTQATQLQQASETTTGEIAAAGTTEVSGGSDVLAPTASSQSLLKQTANDINYTPAQNLTNQGNQGEGSTQQNNVRTNGAQEATGGGAGGVQQAVKARITITIPRPTGE